MTGNSPILILAGGVFQLPLIHAVRRRGLRAVLLDGNPKAPGFEHADGGEVVDIGNPGAVIAAARRIRPRGIASIVNEVSVLSAAAAADDLGLPGIGTEAAANCSDKVLMRTRFQQAGLPCPEFGVVAARSEAHSIAARIGYPVVVKPVDSSGSRGVRRVDRPNEIEVAADIALIESRKGRAIIEAFLDGTEYTIETFTVDGHTEILGVSDKIRLPFPHCVSINLTYSPFLDDPIRLSIASEAKKAIAAAGLLNGAGHIEVMLTPSGPVVVELAARGGGYRIFSDILPRISGIDPVEAVIDQALGATPPIKPDRHRAAVLRFFNPSKTGHLRSVTGLVEARQVENVLDVVIDAQAGQPFRGITRDGERPGYIIAIADTRDQVLRAADRAEELVSFSIDPDSGPADELTNGRHNRGAGAKGERS